MHGATKIFVPYEIPEKQPSGISRPRIGQGGTGVKRKVRPVSIETLKPVEKRPTTHPITLLQSAIKCNDNYHMSKQTSDG